LVTVTVHNQWGRSWSGDEAVTAPAASSATSSVRGLAPAVLLGGAFALATIANTLFHVAFSIWDISDDFGAGDRSPEEQLPVIIVFGVTGLLAALGIGKWLNEDRAPQGAVVLGVLSIVSLPVFFSGAPASFGAMAAVRAGFAHGGSPTTGAPRWFGIAGIVIVVLIIVAVFGGNIAGIIESTAE
jgi:hypothetical protein